MLVLLLVFSLQAPEEPVARTEVGKLVVDPKVRYMAEGHEWREGFQQVRRVGRALFGPHGLFSETETPLHRNYLINELDEKVWIEDSIHFPLTNRETRRYDFYENLWKRFHYYRVIVRDQKLILYLEIEAGARSLTDCPVEPLGGYYQFLARFDPDRKVFVVDRYGIGLDAREFYNKLDVDRKIERLLETARPICSARSQSTT